MIPNCLYTAEIDYNQHSIELTPEDSEYVRYIGEGHQVTCRGGSDAGIKWLKPDGTDVAAKGRVHVKHVDG